MSRSVLLVAVLALSALALPQAEALSRAATVSYQLAAGGVSNAREACERPEAFVVNGACFQLYPGERSAVIEIDDDTGRGIAAEYFFYRGERAIAGGYFCNSRAVLDIPPTSDRLVLHLGESGKLDSGPLPGCHLQRGTGGVIWAVFR